MFVSSWLRHDLIVAWRWGAMRTLTGSRGSDATSIGRSAFEHDLLASSAPPLEMLAFAMIAFRSRRCACYIRGHLGRVWGEIVRGVACEVRRRFVWGHRSYTDCRPHLAKRRGSVSGPIGVATPLASMSKAHRRVNVIALSKRAAVVGQLQHGRWFPWLKCWRDGRA